MTTHTIAFAPSKGPSLLDRFLWEQLPLVVRAMGEKELHLQIAPQHPFAQWHRVLAIDKKSMHAQFDKLLARQSHFGVRAGFKEKPGAGEIVLQLPLAHADEFLSANNIFLHACMPFLHIHAREFSIDFSHADAFHVRVEGEARAVEQFIAFVRNPKLLVAASTPKKSSRTKRKTKQRRGKH